jgi:hypothetical protein
MSNQLVRATFIVYRDFLFQDLVHQPKWQCFESFAVLNISRAAASPDLHSSA